MDTTTLCNIIKFIDMCEDRGIYMNINYSWDWPHETIDCRGNICCYMPRENCFRRYQHLCRSKKLSDIILYLIKYITEYSHYFGCIGLKKVQNKSYNKLFLIQSLLKLIDCKIYPCINNTFNGPNIKFHPSLYYKDNGFNRFIEVDLPVNNNQWDAIYDLANYGHDLYQTMKRCR